MCDALTELRDAVIAYARSFDAEVVTVATASQVVSSATAIEHAAATLKALAAARLVGASSHGSGSAEGPRSAAQSLAAATGSSVSAARQTIALGRRLASQPALSEAARSGEVSPSQAVLISEAAETDPSAEYALLDKARSGASLASLAEEAAAVRAAACPDPEAREAAIRARRRLRSWVDAEGVWHISGLGPVVGGAQVDAAIERLKEELFWAARSQGRREDPAAYAFDALVSLAEEANSEESSPCRPTEDLPRDPQSSNEQEGPENPSATTDHAPGSGSSPRPPQSPGGMGVGEPGTSSGEPGTSSGEPGTSGTNPLDTHEIPNEAPAAKLAVGRRRRGAPVKLLVRVDLEALLRGVPIEGELCELAGYGPVPVSVVHGLLEKGDPFFVAIITKGRQVLGVAHAGRKPTAYQRSALDFLYPSCAAEGCTKRARLEIDHREDWARTRYTMLDLLDALCRWHHSLKTREGWALVEGTGKRPFVPPDDPRHPCNAGGGPKAARAP